MAVVKEMLERNKKAYGALYVKGESFLRYPADWIIRFHNMYMKKNLPTGKVLDFGCGTGNNSIFFIENGYDVFGVDVNEVVLELIKKNLENRHLGSQWRERFSIISPDCMKLPFEDNFFDFVLSNQVLYYLSSEEQIRKTCRELSRCLRPGGIVFFTMMGPRNYYMQYHLKQKHPGGIYEISIDEPGHRLYGNQELIYLVRDEEHLRDIFSEFECVSTGYFDQAMFDMKSNFHWIFIGKKH